MCATLAVVRPPLLSEISAIKALRGGRFFPQARPYSHRHERTWTHPEGFPSLGEAAGDANGALQAEAKAMVARGWRRDEAGWERFHKQIRARNEETMSFVLSI